MYLTDEQKRLRHERIKFELRSRGLSFAKLSKQEGLHRSVFAAISATTKRSRKAATLIAEAIGTTPEALWPEVYGHEGGLDE